MNSIVIENILILIHRRREKPMFQGLENALVGILVAVIVLNLLVLFCYNKICHKLDKIAGLLENRTK
jgi:hypothetical protein